MGLKRAIVRPVASEASSDEALFDSPEFVTRLTRVAQLWHYVLVSRVLVERLVSFIKEGRSFSWKPVVAGCSSELINAAGRWWALTFAEHPGNRFR